MNNEQIKTFISAGKATFTLTSIRTDKSYTFRAVKSETKGYGNKPAIVWVSLLTGPDNTSSYEYLGTIYIGDDHWRYKRTRKSIPNHPVHPVMEWFTALLDQNRTAPALEFRHAGKCGRCGRKLTVPESIDSGLGPHCAGLM